MQSLIDALNALPLAGLMLVIAAGYALGEVSVRGISLGPAGATLFVALLCGYHGVRSWGLPSQPGVDLSLGAFGFMLFIYSVGFEAGPRFFASFRSRHGWRFVVVAATVNVVAVAAAVLCGSALGLGGATVAGSLAGALTSAPTYAAATELTGATGELSVAFALTYPLGLVGVVLLIQVLPRLLGQDLGAGLEEEAEMLAGLRRAHAALEGNGAGPEQTRVFRVERTEATGRPLRELALTRSTGGVLSRIRRGEEILVAGPDTILEVDDRVMASGRLEELRALERLLGPETFDARLQQRLPPPRRIQVRDREVAGKSLAELHVPAEYRCIVTRIEREDLEIDPTADVVLLRGDVVEVVGERRDVRRLARAFGRFEPAVQETHIAIYAGGILLGVMIGGIDLEIGRFDVTFGLAGGLLLSGLVLGWLGRVGPLRAEVPLSARQLVRDLGILLFVGETGLAAGAQVLAGLREPPWTMVLTGAVVTVVTVLGSLVVGRVVLGLRPIDAWGAVSGGLTSSAALLAVRRAADTNQAAVSYAVAYGVGSVLATLAGQVVLWLMG